MYKIIKDIREKNKLNQTQLGNILGVSQNAVSKYELNEALPSFSVIIKLKNRFNLSWKELENAYTNTDS